MEILLQDLKQLGPVITAFLALFFGFLYLATNVTNKRHGSAGKWGLRVLGALAWISLIVAVVYSILFMTGEP